MKPHEAVETKLYPFLKSALFWEEWADFCLPPVVRLDIATGTKTSARLIWTDCWNEDTNIIKRIRTWGKEFHNQVWFQASAAK